MTTIAAYNVNLSLNANEYIKGSKGASRETAKLRRTLAKLRTPAENTQADLRMLREQYKKGSINAKVYNEMMRRMFDRHRKVTSSSDKLTKSQKQLNAQFTKTNSQLKRQTGWQRLKSKIMGTSRSVDHLNDELQQNGRIINKTSAGYSKFAGVIATIGVGKFIKDSIQMSMQAEQAAASFEVLTGSANNAKFLLQEMRDAASQSPITLTGYQQAAKTMLGFGMSARQIMPSMQMIAEVTAGNQEQFGFLARAFAQTQAAGKLMGQELNQMINAGFNPLSIIADKTGKSIADLRQEMSQGKISADMVTQAFVDATKEGGQYAGLLDRMADTTSGKLSTSLSKVQEAMISIGDTFGPIITELTDGFEKGSSALDGLVFIFEKLNNGLGFFVALAKDAVAQVKALASGDLGGFVQVDNVNAYLDKLEEARREQERLKNVEVTGFDESADKAAADMAASIKDIDMDGSIGSQSWWDDLQKWSEQTLEAEKRRLDEIKKANESMRATALQNAREYFEQQKQLDAQRREDIVSKMSGAGAEVGSSQAVAFLAKQQNRLMAGTASGKEPTQRELLAEAKRQYSLLLEQNKTEKEQKELLKKMLAELGQNKFQPIR